MTISERLFMIIDAKGIKKKEFAEKIGVNNANISAWSKRGTTPPMELLPNICNTLDISWEYLITGEEATQEHYTKEEQNLTCIYRATNPIGRQRIMEYASEMQKLHPEQEEDQENLSTSKIS